jgi:hypothetical protein
MSNKEQEQKKYNINELHSISGITWFNIDELKSLFKISKTIIKKRIKNNTPLLIKNKTIHSIKSKKGKPTNYYHISILNDLLGIRKKPKSFSLLKDRRNYIGTSKWDYLGTINPERSTITDLKHKMRFFYNQLILKFGKKKGIKLFYSIEPNPNDKYFHSHFLIRSNTTIENTSFLLEKLNIIGGDKTKDRTPVQFNTYDFDKYQFSGSFYWFKDKSVFDEYLEG